MNFLTLRQPHASLVALGLKTLETRSWSTNYRGDLVICSSKADRMAAVDEFLMLPSFQKAFRSVMKLPKDQGEIRATDLPYGCALCVVDISGCVTTSMAVENKLNQGQEDFGDYAPGRWAWIMKNLRRLPAPVPVKGWQRIFQIKDLSVQTAIVHQLQKLREATTPAE